jgi:hypothetical protein
MCDVCVLVVYADKAGAPIKYSEVCAQVKEWLDSIYDDLEIAYMKDGPIKHPDKRNVKYAQEQAMKGVRNVFDKMSVSSLQAR